MSKLSWSELSWSELSWSELSWSELSWSELSWSELSWTELSWSELSWTALPRSEPPGREAWSPSEDAKVVLTVAKVDKTFGADPPARTHRVPPRTVLKS